MLNRRHEMIGDYRIQQFEFASPENASHWKQTFPANVPTTHEFRYRLGVDPVSRVPFVRFGLYLKNAVVEPGTFRFQLIAAAMVEEPRKDSPEAIAQQKLSEELEVELRRLRELHPGELKTAAAMNEVSTRHKNNREKDPAMIIDELARKILAKRRADEAAAAEPAKA